MVSGQDHLAWPDCYLLWPSLEAVLASLCWQPQGPRPSWVKGSLESPLISALALPLLLSITLPQPQSPPCHFSGQCTLLQGPALAHPREGISSLDTHMAHPFACFTCQIILYWGGSSWAPCHLFLPPYFLAWSPVVFTLLAP